MRRLHGRIVQNAVAMSVIATMAMSLSAAGVARAAGSALFYTGNAYGSYANVGHTIIAGKSAVVSFGCQTQAGRHVANTVASLDGSPLITTGAINTTGDSADTGLVQSSQFTADVHDVDLLSGLIAATEVKAVSTTSNDATGLHVSSTGSTFVSLVVGGTAVTATPAPNTVLSLSVSGQVVGTVTLNEQTRTEQGWIPGRPGLRHQGHGGERGPLGAERQGHHAVRWDERQGPNELRVERRPGFARFVRHGHGHRPGDDHGNYGQRRDHVHGPGAEAAVHRWRPELPGHRRSGEGGCPRVQEWRGVRLQ